MKLNKLLPFSLILIGIFTTGCGDKKNNSNQNTTMVESTTKSSISNNINGVFDGYKYNTENYNLEPTTIYDKNYSNGYTKPNYYNNDRFGNGMKGAKNIKGNENKNTKEKISSDIKNIYDKEKNMYNNVKDDIKNSIRN